MQRMDKHLPDNIDNFFADNLKNYAEAPGKQTWAEIDKRLSEIEKNKKGLPALTILSAAAIIIVYLLLPFLLVNPYLHKQQLLKDQSVSKKFIENTTMNNDELSNTFKNKNINNRLNVQNDEANVLDHYKSQQNFSIAGLPLFNSLNQITAEDEHVKFKGLPFQNIFIDSSVSKNLSRNKRAASTIVKLSEKINFSISPFFSFDHISGRFIEQYEFDNADKNDYRQREKADMSFTVGILAAYQLNKKFSLMSGVSLSNSKLSISSTAINALKDATGVYKFKLATSYGLAEISNSGIIPTEGDSLLISDATMQFNYVSFPILVNYNISNKKVRLSVHSGVALNKLTSEKVEAEYQTQNGNEVETINKIEGIKRTFFTLNTGVEATYSINRAIDISISPEIRYGINSINKGTPVKTYPINYGLAFHLNIKL
jgi:hypothetical protein